MKMKKTKEESTSSGTRKKKGAASKGRLTGMLESMEKRSSPVNAHKVATKYFDDFKKDRNIGEKELSGKEDSAVSTGVSSTVTTAVGSAVKKKKAPSGTKNLGSRESFVQDPLLSVSENKVYGAMYGECLRVKADARRFGLKELKEITGLSDKTIRVSIHSLEKKKCIVVEEPSLGIYGRKFRVLTTAEAKKKRSKEGIEIDPTTKKVVNADYRGK